MSTRHSRGGASSRSRDKDRLGGGGRLVISSTFSKIFPPRWTGTGTDLCRSRASRAVNRPIYGTRGNVYTVLTYTSHPGALVIIAITASAAAAAAAAEPISSRDVSTTSSPFLSLRLDTRSKHSRVSTLLLRRHFNALPSRCPSPSPAAASPALRFHYRGFQRRLPRRLVRLGLGRAVGISN